MATVASQFFSHNVANLIMHMQQDGRLQFDFDDQITAGVCITHAACATGRRRRCCPRRSESVGAS